MYDNRQVIWKRLVVILVVVIVAIVGLALFFNRPGKVRITAEAGAEISVATEKGGKFTKLGTTSATYSTRKVPTEVYIMVSKDGKKTISSSHLKRGKTNELNLALAAPGNATKIANGAYSNVLLNGTLGQGIVPDEYTLISFQTNKDAPTRPEFAALPYIKKVVWYDANNFIYTSLNEGVGRFMGGTATYEAGLGTSVTGGNIDDFGNDELDSIVGLVDVSRSGSKPLVLMSANKLFLSNDMGTSLQTINTFKANDSTNYGLFTTDNYIYRFLGEDPSAYASEGSGGKSTSTTEHASKLYQYDYTGKELASISIDDDTVRAVVSAGDKTLVLTPNKLILAKGSNTQTLDLYFTFARDLISYKGKVLLLGDNGVWQIAEDGVSLQLLYEFKDTGVGLAQSFSISGNKLIFGTQPRPEDTNHNTATYALDL